MADSLFDLTGKTALVTGGNAGIGLGFAQGLAKAGADVVIWGRRADRNHEAVATLSQYGGRVASREVDVTDEGAVREGFAAALEEFGRIDTIVANVGQVVMQPFADMPRDEWRRVLAVNLDSAIITLREGAKHMIHRAAIGDRGGSLVIIGSTAMIATSPNLTAYAASKGALEALTRALAVELGPHGVRVNIVAPGFTVTERMVANPAILEMAETTFTPKIPMGRLGSPQDFHGVAVYLASDASSHQTGDTLVIDGGQMASA